MRILAGERTACEELVRLHHAPIYRLLVHLCRDEHLAEDLAQETFAAAWAAMATFRGSSSLATWLHRIAYRCFVDAHRRRKPPAALDENLAKAIPAATVDPLDGLVADERSRRLYAAIDRLEPQDRSILVLHYLQGLTFRQMAHVLDEPGGTVKWRTSQALARLRVSLEEEADHETSQTATHRTTGWPVAGGSPPMPAPAEGT